MKLISAVDQPTPGQECLRHSILVEGWLYAEDRQSDVVCIDAIIGDDVVGSTRNLYCRRDVSDAVGIDATIRVGFRIAGAYSKQDLNGSAAELKVLARFSNGASERLANFKIRITTHDYTEGPYGDLCNPARTGMLHRSHIYASGHPATTASPDCVKLIVQYLPASSSVLDIGCGVGAYYDPLRNAGFKWLGCETSEACLIELARLQRPFRRVRPRWQYLGNFHLPAARGEFDASIAVEVLEHVRDPDAFISEVRRVTREVALFSVPNLEILPLLADRLVAPWHLLEADHRNFLTRFNLQPLLRQHFAHVEIVPYGRHPLQSPSGDSLYYHLLAICRNN